VKVLLIGFGRWGEKHLRVLGELGCEIWVADVSADRRAFAVKAGVAEARVVADHHAALPHVEAVDLVTPADNHRALASECLRAGKDCFVEKPLTLTVAEGRSLAEVARTTGRVLQVGHIFRFHPVTQFMRERIRSGSVGGVRYATGRFAGFKRPRTDVGVTQTDGIHYFDLFAYMLGREPTAVTATLRDFLGRGLDDVGFCSVEYGPVPAFVEAGYFAPGSYRDCVIVGEQETLAGDFGTAEVTVLANRHVMQGGAWTAPDGAAESHKVSGPEPLSHELKLFLEACTHRSAPAVGVEDGLLALRVVEAARLSSQLGRRVLLSEV
jgi:UDP-N-acetylglucosamine 3-dehydrogenase